MQSHVAICLLITMAALALLVIEIQSEEIAYVGIRCRDLAVVDLFNAAD